MAKRGGKLSRTEVIPVRFDPMLKMAVELAAAHERRPMGSLIEFVVSRAMNEWPVTTRNGRDVSASEIVEECWHEKPHRRLMNLAEQYPELLTIEERKLVQSAKTALRFNDHSKPVSSAFYDIILEIVWPYVIEYAEEHIEVTKLWMECRNAQSWLIEESGCRVAGLLRQFAKDELSPEDFVASLSRDDRLKEQLLNILGEI